MLDEMMNIGVLYFFGISQKKTGCQYIGSPENPKPTTMNRPLYHSTQL